MSGNEWQPIATAPTEASFQLAAWNDRMRGTGDWIVGEAYRDRDEPEKFWWVNTDAGDYHADHLAASGLVPVFWQPMAAPPASPYWP